MSSFSFSAWISMTSSFKKLDLLTDIDMLLIVEKGITGRICLYLSMCKH